MSEQPEPERDQILQVYNHLHQQYGADASILADAPSLAAKWGVPDGKPIRNLPALLAKSWPQVRDFWVAKLSAQIDQQRQQAFVAQRQFIHDKSEEEENDRIQSTFVVQYPSERDQLAALKRNNNGTFDVATPAGRLALIMRWWANEGSQLHRRFGT